MAAVAASKVESLTDSQYVARFAPLVDFLGAALGPTTEVVLHDVADLDASVVAIANSHVSGRKVGSPATDLMLRVLRAGKADQRPYVTGYSALSSTGASHLRSATYFIRRESRIVGMLCINADQTLLKSLEKLTGEIAEAFFAGEDGPTKLQATEGSETLSTSIADITSGAIRTALATRPVTVDHYSAEDRLAVVKLLDDGGFFQLKGAVADLAGALQISEPSISRYLRQVRA